MFATVCCNMVAIIDERKSMFSEQLRTIIDIDNKTEACYLEYNQSVL